MIFLDVFELQKYIMFLTYANNIVIISKNESNGYETNLPISMIEIG